MAKDLTTFKIAVLNDLLGIELHNINIKGILNPEVQSKFRNLKKSTDKFSGFSDEVFKQEDIQEEFGNFCDKINELIDNFINEIK